MTNSEKIVDTMEQVCDAFAVGAVSSKEASALNKELWALASLYGVRAEVYRILHARTTRMMDDLIASEAS